MNSNEICGCGKPTRYMTQDGLACNKVARCMTYEEQRKHIIELKAALQQAIRSKRHTVITATCTDDAYRYTVDWKPEVKRWAELAGVDLSKLNIANW